MRATSCCLLLVLLTLGCTASPPPAPLAESGPPQEERELDLAIHWMRNSAEYQAIVRQTYRAAGERLQVLTRNKKAGTWAVSMDADETTIDNSAFARELSLQGKQTSDELWDGWVARRAAPPVPGVIEYLELVQSLGGRIVIVTNRIDRHCPDTEANFRAYDIPFDAILCRKETRQKEPRWELIEQGRTGTHLPPLEIVMWIGDNIGDFPDREQALRYRGAEGFAGFGNRFFALPNPMYGSWEGNEPD